MAVKVLTDGGYPGGSQVRDGDGWVLGTIGIDVIHKNRDEEKTYLREWCCRRKGVSNVVGTLQSKE